MEIDKNRPGKANKTMPNGAVLQRIINYVVHANTASYFLVEKSQEFCALMIVYPGAFIEAVCEYEVYDEKSLNSAPETCNSQDGACRDRKLSKMSDIQSIVNMECVLLVFKGNYVDTALCRVRGKGLLTPALRIHPRILTIPSNERDTTFPNSTISILGESIR